MTENAPAVARPDDRIASPESDAGPIPLSAAVLDAIRTWAADDRLWGSRSATEFNLCTFARVVLKTQAADLLATITALSQEKRIRVESDCPVCNTPRIWLQVMQGVICPLCTHNDGTADFERAEKADAHVAALSAEILELKIALSCAENPNKEGASQPLRADVKENRP